MWRWSFAAILLISAPGAAEIVRDQSGRLIELHPNGTFFVLQERPQAPVAVQPVPQPVIPYRETTVHRLYQDVMPGDLVRFSGYVGSYNADSFGRLRQSILVFDGRVVEQPYVVLDVTMLSPNIQQNFTNRCQGDCPVFVYGQVSNRNNGITTVVAHAVEPQG